MTPCSSCGGLGRRGARFLLLLVVVPCMAACMQPQYAIRNLDEVHVDDGGPMLGYSTTVSDRGFWWRFRSEISAMFGGDIAPGTEEVEDPLEFCLDNLEALRDADADDLDPLDRSMALVIVAELARRDVARVVRGDALRTCRVLLRPLPERYTAEPADQDAEISAYLPVLEQLAGGTPEEVAALLEDPANRDRAERTARALAEFRADRPALSERLARMAVLAARQVEHPEILPLYAGAATRQAAHTVFLSAGAALQDLSDRVKEVAVQVLLAMDPVGASVLIGRHYTKLTSPLVKVRLFQGLIDTGARAEELDPTLRRYLEAELTSLDASVLYWSRRGSAHLLGLREDSSLDALRAGWQSLASPPAAAES